MTKKHFIALADAIRALKPDTPCEGGLAKSIQYNDTIIAMADFCQSQNPRFNRERWLGYIAGTNGKNGGQIKADKRDLYTQEPS
jgi:hypothetical protein